MSSAQQLLDAAGRRRSPATGARPSRRTSPEEQRPALPGRSAHRGRDRRRDAPGRRRSARSKAALIVVLWRAGLRIQDRLALTETDLDARRGSVLVRHGKNDKRRTVGMDAWAWSALEPWTHDRTELPVGPLLLRDRRADPRPRVAGQPRQGRAAQSRGRRWRAPTVRAAPTPSRPRRRAAPRRDPAAARSSASSDTRS